MSSERREERLASAGDPAPADWLGRLQDASFSRAGPAVRKAYPPQRRMTGPQLASYLRRPTYALASSTRPDGRAHAAPTLFCIYAEAFWLPTVSDAARIANVRAHPWLVLSIIEGEHDTRWQGRPGRRRPRPGPTAPARHPSSTLAVTAPRVVVVRTCRRRARSGACQSDAYRSPVQPGKNAGLRLLPDNR
jgi:hypothetical protein